MTWLARLISNASENSGVPQPYVARMWPAGSERNALTLP